MATDLVLVHVVAVIFLATLIRSSVGFGEALVAVPLLALRIPVKVAVPLAVLVSITVAAIIVIQDWREIHVKSAGGLLGWSLLGIPAGAALLRFVDPAIIKGFLGVLIVLFAAYSLTRGRMAMELKSDKRRWIMGFGFAAGLLGGACGMNGPPLVIYGSLRRWSAQKFRATLQGYFLPASSVGMFCFWLAGLWNRTVSGYYLIALPGAVLAIFLGRIINRRLASGDLFRRVINVGLLMIGVILLAQSLR